MSRDRINTLSLEEIRLILLASASAGGYTYLAILLMLLTGQRVREVLSLEWGHLDLKNAYWNRVRPGQSSWRASPLPLSTVVVQILSRVADLPRLDGDRVLCSPGKEARVQAKVRADVNRELLSAGSSLTWNTYALRHAFAAGCSRIGATPRQIELALDRTPRWDGMKVLIGPAETLRMFRPVAECWALEIEQLLEPDGIAYDSLLPARPALRAVK